MTKLFSINLPLDLHSKLRMEAAKRNITMKDIVIRAIKKELDQNS